MNLGGAPSENLISCIFPDPLKLTRITAKIEALVATSEFR